MDRPSRFSDGSYGVYYAASTFEAAVAETIHHHTRFMTDTAEPAGWTSEFRELVGAIDSQLHDLRTDAAFADCLHPTDYTDSQALGAQLRAAGSDGIVYLSVRQPGAECFGAFHPDVVQVPSQGRHLAYHWDGARVDQLKDITSGQVYEVR